MNTNRLKKLDFASCAKIIEISRLRDDSQNEKDETARLVKNKLEALSF